MLAVDAFLPLAKNVAAMPLPRLARRLLSWTLALAGGVALATAPARAEDAPDAATTPTIYKWVDANGIAHYTTELGRVPRSVRGSVRALGSSPPSSEGFAARDAGATAPPPSAAAPGPAPTEWDQGSAVAATAAAPPPSPTAPEGWAAADRPPELPDEAPAPGAPQTAAAEPSAEPAAAPALTEGQLHDLDQRIAALEAEIASDEETLKGFLAAPAPGDPGEVAYDRSFREVAERLPKRLAELRTLQSERAQHDQP